MILAFFFLRKVFILKVVLWIIKNEEKDWSIVFGFCVASHSFKFIQFYAIIHFGVSFFTAILLKVNENQNEDDGEQGKTNTKTNNNTFRDRRTAWRIGGNNNTQATWRLRDFLINRLTRFESINFSISFHLNRTEVSSAFFDTIKNSDGSTRLIWKRKRIQIDDERST